MRVVGPHGQGRGRGPCLVGRAGLVMTLLWAIAVRIARMGRAGLMQCPPCQVMKFASQASVELGSTWTLNDDL